jgi:hypothetical protein
LAAKITVQRDCRWVVHGGRRPLLTADQASFTHAFVAEFNSEEDRNYYVLQDPAHLAFVGSIGAVVDMAQVVDFEPGVF